MSTISSDPDPSAQLSFLKDLSPQFLAQHLVTKDETLAGLILAHLSPTQSAKVLANMTADRQRVLVSAMRKGRQAPPEVLQRVAASLKLRLTDPLPRSGQGQATPTAPRGPQAWKPRHVESEPVVNPTPTSSSSPRQEAMDRVLNQLQNKRPAHSRKQSTPSSSKAHPLNGMAVAAEILRMAPTNVRKNISTQDPTLYQELRKRMFVFEDLLHTSGEALALVFTTTDPKIAALALRFAPTELAERALATVSPRRVNLLRDEIESGTHQADRVRVREIEMAQQKVLDIALALQKAGKILIDPNDPDLSS